jgi:hypothetical protein
MISIPPPPKNNVDFSRRFARVFTALFLLGISLLPARAGIGAPGSFDNLSYVVGASYQPDFESAGVQLGAYSFKIDSVSLFFRFESGFEGLFGDSLGSFSLDPGEKITSNHSAGFLNFAAGPTWAFNEHIAVYAGISLSYLDRYYNTSFGRIYNPSEWGAGADFGVVFSIHQFSFQAGCNTFTRTVNAGIGLHF